MLARDGGDYWPACGYRQLAVDARGWLRPTDDWWRGLLGRPELAPVDESCAAERRLHQALHGTPLKTVGAAELSALRDPDARDNYRHFLAFRDGVQAAGTLEAWTLQLFRSGPISLPPLFIDLVVQAIVRHGLEGCEDALEVRAAELMFRPQRITLHEGRVLAGDRDTLDLNRETQGLGDLGRLLAEARAPVKPLELRVLDDDGAARYLAHAQRPGFASGFLLDLTHEVPSDLGHGLRFKLAKARSGPKALARVLRRWVLHLLGVAVTIEPVQRIDDPRWRWHLGLDAESSRLLDDLYRGQEVASDRLQRLVCLFRLRFDDPREMRADVAGHPVYLGLMATADRQLRLKPQNLLLNLPLAAAA